MLRTLLSEHSLVMQKMVATQPTKLSQKQLPENTESPKKRKK